MREQQHIETALEKQKLEDKQALEFAVSKALEHYRAEIQLEQDKKVHKTSLCDSYGGFFFFWSSTNISVFNTFIL